MTVEQCIERLQKCSPDARLKIVGELTLECMPQWWDEENQKVAGKATELYSEDLFSHTYYLLAVE